MAAIDGLFLTNSNAAYKDLGVISRVGPRPFSEDLEMPLWDPRAGSRASTFRVDTPPIKASMITAWKAWSTRRQGSRIEGKSGHCVVIAARKTRGLWDQQLQIAHLGGQGAMAVAVAVPETLHAALMALSIQKGGELQLDQPLQARRASSGISSPAVLPSSSEARSTAAVWAGFVWLRWFSNQGNGPAHPGSPRIQRPRR
jgi:hypothetical protein